MREMAKLLEGKVAIVTGAAHGIGRGHALELAKHGALVVVNDVGGSVRGEGHGSDADLTVAKILERGGQAVANYADISDMDQAEDLVRSALNEWGQLDILVNVAGILRDRMIFNMTEEEWDIVLAVHLKGTYNTSRAASVHMREKKGGRMINMSSVSALGAPGQPNRSLAP